MLLGLIDDPSNLPPQVVLPTRLVERASCRPLVAGA
jgi:DNA-binding LacI/PurR family transcriptional regulator